MHLRSTLGAVLDGRIVVSNRYLTT